VSWITADQLWAVRAVAEAGVPIRVHESIMMRGSWRPTLPLPALRTRRIGTRRQARRRLAPVTPGHGHGRGRSDQFSPSGTG
jgi:hypothetical protein